MAMTRREFLNVLAAAAASGLPLSSRAAVSGTRINGFYDLANFGANVTLLHFTDCHAQLLPVYYREPSINIGVGDGIGRPPHLVGEALLKHYAVSPGSKQAYALTHLNFQDAARRYGKVGGFAHLATLVKRVRDQRPGALLLDGGDTWQGSATSLWTKGQDMIDACKLLGVDVMTGHWEFTYGAERVEEVIEKDFKDKIEFVAQNVKTTDFGDAVFKPYVMREMNGIPIAIVGQAFPYTPIANPRYLVPDWTFGIQEENLQKVVNEARGNGAQVVVVLSHNGMDVDLKLANRVSGITAILGGHTHDALPLPVMVKNHNGYTVVTNAGCNGKFLGVLDLHVENGRVGGYQYKLLPVFSNLLPPDHEMSKHVKRVRAPYESKLNEKLATAGELLYRRGNFNGTFDQVILDALMEVKSAEIAFSPGFRWGTTLLPGDPITMERLMDQTAITYPFTTVTDLTGERIKEVLEAVCDNLFHPDPYLQQGGDMVRVGGMTYTCDPTQTLGSRISDMRMRGKPMQADKTYKVAGWAPVAEGASGEPIWDVVAKYLRHKKTVSAKPLNVPKLVGVEGNPGVA